MDRLIHAREHVLQVHIGYYATSPFLRRRRLPLDVQRLCPGSSAAVSSSNPTEVRGETILCGGRSAGDERAHLARKRRVGFHRRIRNECAVAATAVAIHVTLHNGSKRQARLSASE